MNNKYDVAIIGGGPSAIFAAYELIKQKPDTKAIMIEAGNDIYTRQCPIAEKKVNYCIGCNPCGIMRGFGGAGAFSDGKYIKPKRVPVECMLQGLFVKERANPR